jgi:hypothetical protein
MSKPGNPPQAAGMMLVENCRLPGWLLGLLLVLLLLFFVAAIFLDLAGVPNVPFHMHSDLAADYSKDPLALQLPVMRLDVVQDALDDLGAPDGNQQVATLQIILSTPAPTVTPAAGAIVTPVAPGATGTPAPQPTLRPTKADPTVTPGVVVVTLTLTPGATPTLAITATLPPTSVFATPTPTRRATLPATQANPTATHANTPRPTDPAPTQPPATVPPSSPTPRPTDPPATSTPRPTNPPATSTPRPTNPPPPTDPPPPTPDPYPYP